MRSRWHRGLVLLPVLGLWGCAAGVKPCLVIPAQIDLARDVRDQARAQLEEKKVELTRWKQNIEQSHSKIARLTEERDQLRVEVGGAAAPGQEAPKETPEETPKQEEKK